MYLLKIKGTDHFIAKKTGGLKCNSQTNLKMLPMLPIIFISIPCLSIQSSLKKSN